MASREEIESRLKKRELRRGEKHEVQVKSGEFANREAKRLLVTADGDLPDRVALQPRGDEFRESNAPPPPPHDPNERQKPGGAITDPPEVFAGEERRTIATEFETEAQADLRKAFRQALLEAKQAIKILQSTAPSCHPGPETENRAIGQVEIKQQFNRDAGDAVEALVEELIPTISPGQIKRLHEAIRAAQTNPPNDKKRFVGNVNRLLDVHRLRIQLDNQEHYKLTASVGASGVSYIQFVGAKGAQGGFKTAKFDILPVEPHFFGNRKPITPHSQVI